MKLNKDIIYSNKSFFGIPTYYDKKNDLYFCEPENKEFLSKFYEKQYWDNFSRKKNILNIKGIILNKILNYLNINDLMYISDLSIINNFKILKKNKILEIGVGFGKNIKTLYKKGFNIRGLEIDKTNIKNINNHLKKDIVIEGNYEDIELREKFDIIYLRHVLEHFYNINKVIQKFKKNLTKNGIIYINVPNSENNFILNESINNHPHIYHFTKKSLRKIFEENGYETLHISTYNFIINNQIINLIKSFGNIGNFKEDNINKSEFLIGIFKNK